MFLAFTEADHWRPGIGDPTFMGWLTVVAYFTAVPLCWMAGRSDQSAHPQSGGQPGPASPGAPRANESGTKG